MEATIIVKAIPKTGLKIKAKKTVVKEPLV